MIQWNNSPQNAVGLQSVPENEGLEALLSATIAPSMHDVLKHLVYSSTSSSEDVQEIIASATEDALRAE